MAARLPVMLTYFLAHFLFCLCSDESAAFGNNSPFIDATRFIDACSVRELPNGETTGVASQISLVSPCLFTLSNVLLSLLFVLLFLTFSPSGI